MFVLSPTFGPNLRTLRVNRRWSQRELALRADTHQRRLSLLENGLAPRPAEVEALAKALGVSSDVLIGPNLIAVPMADPESQPAA